MPEQNYLDEPRFIATVNRMYCFLGHTTPDPAFGCAVLAVLLGRMAHMHKIGLDDLLKIATETLSNSVEEDKLGFPMDQPAGVS